MVYHIGIKLTAIGSHNKSDKSNKSCPMKTSFAKYGPLIVVCVLSITLWITGWHGRTAVLSANPCKMTYTTKEKSIIKLDAQSSMYKLWKISNPRNKKVNYQPVLFIPGHLGSVDQARSLASHMHNDKDFFQYYALDFQEEATAFHGSESLAQAAFTNAALSKIAELHGIASVGHTMGSGLKIIVVAHSLGGIVARAAVLLSNHPQCVVSDILMLSSPNSRSPYTPDPSVEQLFASVNKAWLLSYYNTTKACQTSSVMASLNSADAPLTADYQCPVCAPHIRLVSISGGDIDLHVAPALTHLHDISARPRNVSLDLSKQAGGGFGVMNRVTQIKKYVVQQLVGASMSAVSTLTGGLFAKVTENNSSAVQSDNNTSSAVVESSIDGTPQQCDAATGNTCTVDEATSVQATAVNTSAVDAQFSFITRDSWQRHIMPYIEPQMLSVRTSQLRGVGFPVDHTAVLWCHQLLQVVTSGLTVLSKTPVHDQIDLSVVFPLRSKYSSAVAVDGVRGLAIEQLSRYVARNHSLYSFQAAAGDEAVYTQGLLSGSAVRLVAVQLVTQHSIRIVICHLLVSLLSITVFMLRGLAGHSSGPSPLVAPSGVELLRPWTHWNLDLLWPAAVSLLLSSGVAPTAIPALVALTKRTVPMMVVSKVVYDWLSLSAVSFSDQYIDYLFWIVSYFIALTVRMALLGLVSSTRSVFGGCFRAGRFVLRATVWNKFVRRAARKGGKTLSGMVAKIPFASTVMRVMTSSVVPLAVVSVWLAVFLKTRHRMAGPEVVLGATTYGLSVVSVVFYAAMVVALLLAVVSNPFDSKVERNLHSYFTECTLLYLPAPVLAWPSFAFAVKLLYGRPDQFHAAAPLFAVFGPERIHYCLCLVFISVHLWRLRSKGHNIDSVHSLTWAEELFGPRAISSVHNAVSASSEGKAFSAFSLSSISSSPVDCVHEDGGVHAVFEQFDTAGTMQQVAAGVSLGSNYRVVHCDCAKNPRLQHQSEWCDWCRCRKCGGKHLPKERSAHYYGADGGTDYSIDLAVLAVMYALAIMAVLKVADQPYLYFYHLGLAATAFFISAVAKSMKLSV